MGSQSRPQQRPESFDGIDVNFTEAVAIFVAGILALAVTDCLVAIVPISQLVADVVFIRQDHWENGKSLLPDSHIEPRERLVVLI
jgi:hypothetical protein